jgi:two-component system, OmpR family, sensor kinase
MVSEHPADERLRNLDDGAKLTFGNPNISQMRDQKVTAQSWRHGGLLGALYHGIVLVLRLPWPLIARVPVVAGTLIFIVSLAVSHGLLSTVAHEQEVGVRQLAAVYLDGISTTVYPHVAARNLTNTLEALHRTMWFHQSMKEQRALVVLPDGTLFADVTEQAGDPRGDDPYHDLALGRRVEHGGGFVFDAKTGTGWAERKIVREDRYIGDLYVSLELKPLIEERRTLRQRLLVVTVAASLAAAAIGFWIVRRMVTPLRLLTERLRQAQAGNFQRVPMVQLPPEKSDYGELLRGYNDLIGALQEREALAQRLSQREREGMLGRLAATLAHEVRNPLGGMSTALDTVRKFGDDSNVRVKALDLIERGLLSIGNVVNSVLAFHRMPADGRQLSCHDLEDLRTLIEPEAIRRQLRLSWESAVTGMIGVPATETRQIALNLLLNACEASPPGSEVGFCACIETSRDGTVLRLDVVDAGSGLPPEIATVLTQGGAPSTRGLGVSVVHDLVHGLGGTAQVASISDGTGSCITVRLPTASTVAEGRAA